MNTPTSSQDPHPVTFGRIPVFDGQKNLWGYELAGYAAGDKEQKLSKEGLSPELVSGTALAMEQTLGREKKVLVRFSLQNILENLPHALPPHRTAVRLANAVKLTPKALNALLALKKEGYAIALDWHKDVKAGDPAFKAADIICLDVSAMVLPELTAVCEKIQPFDAAILADNVHDQAGFDICAKAGAHFFKGAFFKQPEDVSVKKIVSGTVSRFKLMEAIEQKDPDFKTLAKVIQADVAISFRLLSYLNSASFGFRRKIDSIKDAITLMGWQQLRNWLRVILLADVAENRNAPELVFLSAQRGKFLEQVGLDHDYWGFEPDSLLLLGMFSLLDALLNQSMEEIIQYLPLADKLKGALCLSENNEYVPLLELARHFEDGQFEEAQALISRLGLDMEKVSTAFFDAICWANTIGGMPVA